jgi:hypothetical protein
VGLTVHRKKKKNFLTKRHKGPRTWTDSVDKRPKLRKMDIDWFDLAQDEDKWRTLINTEVNLLIP